jgi:hypothetical protein
MKTDIQQNVKWLIEDFSSDNGTTELAQAARDLGFEVKLCDVTNPFEKYDEYFDKEACVVTQTSIQSAFKVMEDCPLWIPGAWYKQNMFQCSYYYQFFGEYLFNDKYVMLPAGEVIRRLDDLYDWLGEYDNIFIRPSSGCKTFTGQLFDRKHFAKDWDVAMNYGGAPTDLVVVSTPKIIRGEYRYVIGDGKIIASSEYSWNSKPNVKEAPKHLEAYVDMVLSDVDYDPDPVWILDVALDADLKPYVLEVGSFSSSGLYACNKSDIVTKVSEIAYREWKDKSTRFRI